MGDLVPDVLHRRREVVGGTPVAAHEHDIFELLVRELDAAAYDVIPRRDGAGGHANPNVPLTLEGPAPRHELAGHTPAVVQPVELEGHLAVPVESEPAQ